MTPGGRRADNPKGQRDADLAALTPERRALWNRLYNEFWFRLEASDEGWEAVHRRYRERLQMLGVAYPTPEDSAREERLRAWLAARGSSLRLATDESRRQFNDQWKRDRADGVRPWKELLRETRTDLPPRVVDAAVAAMLQETLEAIQLEEWLRKDEWSRRRHGDQSAPAATHRERERIAQRMKVVRRFAQESIDFYEGGPMETVRPLLVAVAQELRDLELREVDLRELYVTPPGVGRGGGLRLANLVFQFLDELGFTTGDIAAGLRPYGARMARAGSLTEKLVRDRLDKIA